MPDEAEAHGLLALILLQDARREARRGDELVLLDEQDRALWDAGRDRGGPAAARASALARPAGSLCAAGRDRGQARPSRSPTGLRSRRSTRQLAEQTRSPVVELNRAVAVAMAEGAERGLELMDAIELPRYHLLHSARADLLRRLGRREEAEAAYRRALELGPSEPERSFLERRLLEVRR